MQSEREYFNELVKEFGNYPKFCIEMFQQNKPIPEARNILTKRLTEENKELKLKKKFLTEDGGKVRSDLLKLNDGDEEKAFSAYKFLVNAEA